MFPDFGKIGEVGDKLAQQFDQLIALLTEIRDSNVAILAKLEEKDHG